MGRFMKKKASYDSWKKFIDWMKDTYSKMNFKDEGSK